eukprot:Nitzschia sp. Nitz4//scaffold11_size288233//32975//36366//NITZ4_000735-RA/size288233-augustus-gene-0.99-mRNA-1//1//CDS//3329533957//7048//frame0
MPSQLVHRVVRGGEDEVPEETLEEEAVEEEVEEEEEDSNLPEEVTEKESNPFTDTINSLKMETTDIMAALDQAMTITQTSVIPLTKKAFKSAIQVTRAALVVVTKYYNQAFQMVQEKTGVKDELDLLHKALGQVQVALQKLMDATWTVASNHFQMEFASAAATSGVDFGSVLAKSYDVTDHRNATTGPLILGGTLTHALQKARASARFLVVYLPCSKPSGKSLKDRLAIESLLSQDVSEAESSESFLVWSAKAGSTEALSAARVLNIKLGSNYYGDPRPTLMVVNPVSSTSSAGKVKVTPKVVAKHHCNPPPSPSALTSWLESIKRQYRRQFDSMKTQLKELQYWKERTEGYSKSQETDKQREQQVQLEKARVAAAVLAEEQRQEALEARRIKLREALPEEPQDQDTKKIAIRLSDGRSEQRKFAPESTLGDVLNWVDVTFEVEREKASSIAFLFWFIPLMGDSSPIHVAIAPTVRRDVLGRRKSTCHNSSSLIMVAVEVVEPTVESASEDGSTSQTAAPPPTSDEPVKQAVSLADRAKIPNSLYLSITIVLTAHYCGNIWSNHVLQNWLTSMSDAYINTNSVLLYTKDVMQAFFEGKVEDWTEFAKVCVLTSLIGSLLYVVVGAPLLAGFWTGTRAAKHLFHRYMGLLYLAQYFAVWMLYLTKYEVVRNSYLAHFIALNGVAQGYSALFSFKVLPELDDPGYYSDKAVASRTFVHENVFFSMMAVFGSIYYNDEFRANLKAHWAGRVIEGAFVFFPYIVIRTWFPLTRFSNAGTGRNGRSEQNELFYTIGVKMVKIFYLWAKYFLGFFVNFLVFLEAPTEPQWKVIYGMYLLNLGTISIAIFLHTLRFRKVLPAKLTFSIYLLQIYATFSAIPLAYDMFLAHKVLCGLCFSGIALNMTRSRPLHGVWCCVALYLLTFRDDIEW